MSCQVFKHKNLTTSPLWESGRTVVAEVKQVDRNPEGAGLRSLAGSARGWKGLSGTPGQRVHKKIADASKQVKALTKERLPGILVLTVGGLTSAD